MSLNKQAQTNTLYFGYKDCNCAPKDATYPTYQYQKFDCISKTLILNLFYRPPTANSNSPIKKKTPETTPNNQGAPPNRPYNQQHWLIQEAERRRISEQQMRHYQQEYQNAPAHNAPAHSPVYENSNYLGGMPQNAPQVPQNGPQMPPHVPPPSQVRKNRIIDHFD